MPQPKPSEPHQRPDDQERHPTEKVVPTEHAGDQSPTEKPAATKEEKEEEQ